MSAVPWASALEAIRELRWWFPPSQSSCSLSGILLGAIFIGAFLLRGTCVSLPAVLQVPHLDLALCNFSLRYLVRTASCQGASGTPL